MTRADHPIHRELIEALDLQSGQTLLDLGCGGGHTLRRAVGHVPVISVIGIDSNQNALDHAASVLSDHNTRLELGDLSEAIALEDGTVDRIVCHNVLECLAVPEHLLAEAVRLLAPGGRAVWSHVDFGAITINAADEDRNQKVIAAYANLAQPWMGHVDGYMGRKLPGLIRQSPLQVDQVAVHSTYEIELTGSAAERIDEMTLALRDEGNELSPTDVTAWRADIEKQHLGGTFFFMEPTVIVTTSIVSR